MNKKIFKIILSNLFLISLIFNQNSYSKQVWISGEWVVSNNEYVWKEGSWVDKKPGYIFLPGYWKQVPGGWTWVSGSVK